MAVIHEPQLSPDELLESQAQLSQRRKAERAQEIISQSLINQPAGVESSSVFNAALQYMSLKKNAVFKGGDSIENVVTFKNQSLTKIPKNCRLVRISGDSELSVAGVSLPQDVKANEFFKMKIALQAPAVSKHYSAVYRMVDHQGNFFGDKVHMDVIVEDYCSESVIL